MRVCNRHRDRESVGTIQYQGDKSEVDLCAECLREYQQWAAARYTPEAAAKRGRPKKTDDG